MADRSNGNVAKLMTSPRTGGTESETDMVYSCPQTDPRKWTTPSVSLSIRNVKIFHLICKNSMSKTGKVFQSTPLAWRIWKRTYLSQVHCISLNGEVSLRQALANYPGLNAGVPGEKRGVSDGWTGRSWSTAQSDVRSDDAQRQSAVARHARGSADAMRLIRRYGHRGASATHVRQIVTHDGPGQQPSTHHPALFSIAKKVAPMLSSNKHPLLRLCAFALCLAPMSVSCAYADGAIPIVSPDSHNVVRFTYSKQTVFHIKTRPHMITDLRLAPGETMEMLVLGNTDQWITASAPGNVFLKPTQPGLETSGTLVTNLRTYQLLITSSKNNNWYQQVSWMSGPMVALKSSLPNYAQSEATPAPTPALKTPIQDRSHQNEGQAENIKNMSNLNFNYRVSGDASFKPTEVFDNGTFTWIAVPLSGNAPMPALFVREHGQYAIANYTIRGHYMIVQQLFKKAELRIGDRKAFITQEPHHG